MSKRQKERLIVLLLAGILAFNFPVLALFAKPAFFCGLPVLYLYLFSAWATLILLVATVLGLRSGPPPIAKTGKPEKAD